MENEYRLKMKNISKFFPGVKAVDDVTFCVKPGEVHALTGENGAGKSTLMKILSGAYTKDKGEIYLDGELIDIKKPKEAIDLGISIIYQEFMLAPSLTVAENIFIDRLTAGKRFINWFDLKKKAAAELESIGFSNIKPTDNVKTLSVAYKQIVEICKCLTRKTKVLVLDEPTTVLTHTETKKLFDLVRKLASTGVSIIFISHRLEEIFEICDRVTVMKDGGYVNTVSIKDVDKEGLVNMMIGRKMSQMYPERHTTVGEEVLRIEHLSDSKLVKDINLNVRKGEVVGLGGLVGAGRTETLRIVFGASKKTAGTITYRGQKVSYKNTRQAVKAGIAMLPEDRKKQGLLINQSIRCNTTIATLNTAFIDLKKEEIKVIKSLEQLSTKYTSIKTNVGNLSGGNQQKVAISKWILADSELMILDEPARGVDVGAKKEIYQIINRLAEKGVAIIIVSSEMTELIGMCDRVYVLRNGRNAGEVIGNDITEQNLINLAMGVNENE